MQKLKIIEVGQYLLLAIAFLLPLFFLPSSVQSLEILKTFILLITGIVLGVILILQKIKKNSFFMTKNLLWISVVAVLLSALLSTIFSSNIGVSLFGRQVNVNSFLSLFVLFSLAYSISTIFEDSKSKIKLFMATYISLLVVVAFHVLHILIPAVPSFGFFGAKTMNTIGSWYELGFVGLFVLLASSLILQFLNRTTFYKVCGIVGMILSAILVVLVNSLLIWYVTAGFAIVYVIFNALYHNNESVHDRISYPAIGVLVFSIIFILIGAKISIIVNQNLAIQFNEVKPSISGTTDAIKNSLMSKPIFGEGLNRFEVAWLQHKPQSVNNSQYWDTGFTYGFSNVFSVPITQGVIGIVSWIFFISVIVYYLFKLMFIRPESKSDSFIYLYSVLGSGFFLVVMTVYAPSVVLIGFFFIFLGFLISNLNAAGLIKYDEVFIDTNPRKSFTYILSLVVLLIAFVYAGFIVISQYVSRVVFDDATLDYAQTGNLQNAEMKISNAQFIYPSDLYLRALSEVGMLRINALLGSQNIPEDQLIEQFQTALRSTVGYAQAAIEYDPQSYVSRISLLGVYKNLNSLQVPGAKDEALKVIDDASKLVPNNPSTYLERARVYSQVKEFDQAITEIKKALELKPNFVDAVFLLSQIQVEKGEIDQAVSSIQSALGVSPRNPNLHFQLGLLRYNQQRYADSIISFENAVIIAPGFGNAKYFLGLSYYQGNRTPEAIAQFEDLEKMYPQNQEVSFILNNIKEGKDAFDGAQPPLDTRPEDRETPPVDGDQGEIEEEEITE